MMVLALLLLLRPTKAQSVLTISGYTCPSRSCIARPRQYKSRSYRDQ